jgi:UDP-N-acetylmuramoyl-L-alanyl-D-glutamate--2,6-diaminopimelate ligase
MAANYFGHPSEKLNLVGITGTNGKTTIASLYQFKSRFKVGLISTVKILVDDIEYKAHTTPDSITINHYLAEMRCRVEYCL